MNERTKNLVGWALVLALLALTYSTISYVRTYGKTVEPGTYRSFSVSGEGRATVRPDVAMFTFSVISEGGKDLAVLQADNTKRANAAIEYLKDNDVAEKDIKTVGYNLEPRYQSIVCNRFVAGGNSTACPPPEIVGYTVRQTIEVKIRDFSVVGDLLAGVVERGANNVSQLNFTIDDRTMVENEARAEAIAKAKAKAKAIAEAGGFSLGKLLAVNEGDFGPYYDKFGRGGDMVMAAGLASPEMAPAPVIEPGSEEVTVNVSLVYEIQ